MQLGALRGVMAKVQERGMPVLPKQLANGKWLGKRSKEFWIWAGAVYVLGIILMLMLIKLSFSGKALTEAAIMSGQQVVLHVASGEVEGKLHPAQEKVQDILTTAVPVANKDGLTQVPSDDLVEHTDKSILPITSKQGIMPWKYYARPHDIKDKKAIIAIVFTNSGLSRTQTDALIKLPHDFTISFSPYAGDTGKWAVRTRREGFESLVDLPIQPEDYPLSDPGIFGLMEDLSPEENISRMHSILEEYPGFVGMLDAGNEKMTGNRDLIRPYLAELKKRGLLFVYLKTQKNANLEEFAKSNGFFVVGADKVIDNEGSRGTISDALQSLTETAKTQGYAVGIAHSYPITVDVLQEWAENLKSEGVELVPLSAIGNKLYP